VVERGGTVDEARSGERLKDFNLWPLAISLGKRFLHDVHTCKMSRVVYLLDPEVVPATGPWLQVLW
jgi:hypothetical protein